MDTYINDPKDETAETRERLVELAEDFRRKSNILFAFIRQSARESKEGFCPGSDLADKNFDSETFLLNPTRPRLVDLLTEEEAKKFKRMRVTARPTYVMTEMNLLAYRIISLSKDTSVRINLDNKFQDILSCWNGTYVSFLLRPTQSTHPSPHPFPTPKKGMLRVVDLRIPFPYTHVVNLLTFIFVFGAPFIYTSYTDVWGAHDVILFSSLLLVR